MFEGLTWLWTIVVGGIAGTLTDLLVRGAEKSVYGGLFPARWEIFSAG